MQNANSQRLVASILTFLFAENKKEHPMPADRAETLLRKIRSLIHRKEENNNG